jgi:hypothetical protein
MTADDIRDLSERIYGRAQLPTITRLIVYAVLQAEAAREESGEE